MNPFLIFQTRLHASVAVLPLLVLSVVAAPAEKPGPLGFSLVIPRSTEPVVITSRGVKIVNLFSRPQIEGVSSSGPWSHVERTERERMLGGRAGTLTTDRFRSEGLELSRDTWISRDGRQAGFRHTLLNRADRPIRLRALHPFDSQGPEGFSLEREPKDWTVLVEERHKNGLPRAVSPVKEPSFEADPFFLLDPGAGEKRGILIGHLSQMGHLAAVRAEFTEAADGTAFKRVFSDCQFDGIAVPPGGERSSQWLLLWMGDSPRALIDAYADAIGRFHGVRQPRQRPPSVFCTWYYHGFHYNEGNFREDLEALAKNRMPFDVFLIDECWSLNRWGDFEAIETWPSGMKAAADQIRALGYRPGIWTCPYLVDFETRLARNRPEWLLKDTKGQPVIFTMNKRDHWVLDPTFPGVCDYLEETYRKLADDWGYEYFKFDFMRAVFVDSDQKFYNPELTRLEAYRMGLEAIRRGTGPDAYLSVCGGHYGGSLGIADSQRSGSDVLSIWRAREIPKFRQNLLRTWMSRLWHVDPDAMMVRRNTVKVHPDTELSLGLLTDAEAQTVALNQYLGGGLVCFTEPMARLDEDRRALYRHVIPSVNSRSVPLDLLDPLCPGTLLTRVVADCKNLEPWVTVSLVNWTDAEKSQTLSLNEEVVGSLDSRDYLVFDFWKQKVLGVFRAGSTIELEPLAPHASRLLRIAPWNGRTTVLAGTDLHFSGGAVEIEEWEGGTETARGRLKTDWDYPVTVTVAFPDLKSGFIEMKARVDPQQPSFSLRK